MKEYEVDIERYKYVITQKDLRIENLEKKCEAKSEELKRALAHSEKIQKLNETENLHKTAQEKLRRKQKGTVWTKGHVSRLRVTSKPVTAGKNEKSLLIGKYHFI